MQEWLQEQWRKSKYQAIGFVLLFIITVYFILKFIALVSDIGFSDEVRAYRTVILGLVSIVALIAVITWFITHTLREKARLQSDKYDLELEKQNLEREINDLKQQRDSIIGLMELYKPEAQESVITRLKELAIISLRKQQWKKKEARIERFRIEEPPINSEAETSVNIIERVSVIINIGTPDGVIKGMRFIAQDPTDSLKYGTIIVNDAFNTGSVCSVMEMNHTAFWSDVVQAINTEEGRIGVYTASANVIVPQNPLKELNPDSAKQLLEWLQTIENIEL